MMYQIRSSIKCPVEGCVGRLVITLRRTRLDAETTATEIDDLYCPRVGCESSEHDDEAFDAAVERDPDFVSMVKKNAMGELDKAMRQGHKVMELWDTEAEPKPKRES